MKSRNSCHESNHGTMRAAFKIKKYFLFYFIIIN